MLYFSSISLFFSNSCNRFLSAAFQSPSHCCVKCFLILRINKALYLLIEKFVVLVSVHTFARDTDSSRILMVWENRHGLYCWRRQIQFLHDFFYCLSESSRVRRLWTTVVKLQMRLHLLRRIRANINGMYPSHKAARINHPPVWWCDSSFPLPLVGNTWAQESGVQARRIPWDKPCGMWERAVLPLPAPAMIMTGPLAAFTASTWTELRSLRNFITQWLYYDKIVRNIYSEGNEKKYFRIGTRKKADKWQDERSRLRMTKPHDHPIPWLMQAVHLPGAEEFFRFQSAAYPTSFELDPMTRWHGTDDRERDWRHLPYRTAWNPRSTPTRPAQVLCIEIICPYRIRFSSNHTRRWNSVPTGSSRLWNFTSRRIENSDLTHQWSDDSWSMFRRVQHHRISFAAMREILFSFELGYLILPHTAILSKQHKWCRFLNWTTNSKFFFHILSQFQWV